MNDNRRRFGRASVPRTAVPSSYHPSAGWCNSHGCMPGCDAGWTTHNVGTLTGDWCTPGFSSPESILPTVNKVREGACVVTSSPVGGLIRHRKPSPVMGDQGRRDVSSLPSPGQLRSDSPRYDLRPFFFSATVLQRTGFVYGRRRCLFTRTVVLLFGVGGRLSDVSPRLVLQRTGTRFNCVW